MSLKWRMFHYIITNHSTRAKMFFLYTMNATRDTISYTTTWDISACEWLRAVVFQVNLKYLPVKITNLLRVVV